MTDRIVKVVLRGDISDLVGKLRASTSAVNATVNSMTDGTREAQKFRQGLTTMGDSAGKIGLVAAGGVALAVKSFADFDQAISNVAATGEDARGSLDQLREAALEAGARTKYSATEAANAVETLAKAGLSAADILNGGLNGALDLAAAGGLEVADAAQYAAIAMKQFGLEGSSIPHIADLLSAGAGKAVGDVSDLGAALQQSGLVAKQTGLTIEETTAALSAFASAGLLGSDAGTSLKTMLQSLTPSSKAAANAIEEYNLSAYDAQGNFIGLEALAGKLQAGLSDMSAEQRNATLKTIYGSDAVRAAAVLYDEGAAGIKDWTAAVNDQGYAAETAAVRMDNLKGDLEKLGGALQTGLIGSGEGANGPLRELVQLLTTLVDAYNALPGPVKTAATSGLALTAALGGTVFVASRLVNAVASTREGMANLGASFDGVNKRALAIRGGVAAAGIALASLSGPAHEANEDLGTLTDAASAAALGFAVGGPWGAALAGGIGLLSALASGSSDAASRVDRLTATLDAQTGAITTNTAEMAAKELRDSGVADKLDKVGVSLATATDAALGNAAAMEIVREASERLGLDQSRTVGIVEELANGLASGKEEFRAVGEAADGSVEAQAAAATTMDQTAEAAETAADQIQGMKDALDSLLDPLLSQEDASNAWKESLAGLTDALKENGPTLDDNTEKGRANQDAIRDRVKALKTSAQADLDAGVASDIVSDKLIRGAKNIVKAGEAAGFSEREMRSYLRQLGLTPEQIRTVIDVDTDGARRRLFNLQDQIDSLRGRSVPISIRAIEGGDGPRSAHGGAIPRALGGSVIGPGTATSDSIMAIGPGAGMYALSNGEHIFTADEVNKIGGQAATYALREQIRNGQFAALSQRRFADGGGIGASSSSGGGLTAQAVLDIVDHRLATITLNSNVAIGRREAGTIVQVGSKFDKRSA